MTVPLVILAVLSIVGRLLRRAPARLARLRRAGSTSGRGARARRVRLRRSRRSGASARSGPSRSAAGCTRRYRERDPIRSLGPLYTLLERKYYLDDIYMRGIVRPIQYTLSAAVNWTNTYDPRRDRQRRRVADAQARRSATDAIDRERRSTARSTASRSEPAGPAACSATSSRATCSATPRVLFARRGRSWPSSSRESDDGKERAMSWFDDWAITLAMFMPAVGALVVALVPERARPDHPGAGHLFTGGPAGDRHRSCCSGSTSVPGAFGAASRDALQFEVDASWIDGDRRPLPRRHRRDQPAAVRADASC